MFHQSIRNKIIFIFWLIVLTVSTSRIAAQSTCNYSIGTGADTTLCSPASMQLHGQTNALAADIRTINWQPVAGLSNAFVLNPTANIASSVTYHLNITAVSDSNLIINGSFNSGNTGFTTTYGAGTGGTWGLLSNAGTYDVNTDPHLDHSNWPSYHDHTTGTGNMMLVNGDSVPNQAVWCESISVVPNTNYSFSLWLTTIDNDNNPARLQFSINGIFIGTPFNASLTPDIWTQFFQNWNSGTNTTASICIVNQNIQVGGNDFALDDISFRQLCSMTDSIQISLANPGSLNLGIDTTICSGQSLMLDASAPNVTSHLWSTGDTTSTIHVRSPDTYYVTNVVGGLCNVSDTIEVEVEPILVDIDSSTVILNTGQVAPLASSVSDPFSGPPYVYSWTPSQFVTCDTCSETSVIGDPANTNSYLYLTVMDLLGCRSRDSVLIIYIGCDADIKLPNVFTPNSDGFNDTYYIQSHCADSTFHFTIYNRWGKNVFESADPDFHWNGKIKSGADASSGTYYYECTIGNRKLHGNLELIRK